MGKPCPPGCGCSRHGIPKTTKRPDKIVLVPLVKITKRDGK